MGTRGFVGWLTNDRELRGSYNHYDSYPTWLGREVQKQLADGLPSSAGIEWVDAESTPEGEAAVQAATLGLHDPDVSTGEDWYSVLRKQQGDLVAMAKNGIATADHDFPRDSLFCEWGYVIDEATQEVVILRGFNQVWAEQAPYCTASPRRVREQLDRGGSIYYGCRELWRGTREQFLALDMDELEATAEATANAIADI